MSRKARPDSTATLIQQRYGPQALRRASDEITRPLPPHIATGFAALDAITLLSGQATSGKMTVAYKTLAQYHASRKTGTVALLDLSRTVDPEYLARCGVDLDRLLIARPIPCAATGAAQNEAQQVVRLLLDLARRAQVRFILLDSLPNLLTLHNGARWRGRALGQLHSHLRATHTALLVVDDASPAWLRWLNWDRGALVRPWAALHVALRREAWLTRNATLVGYRAQAQVLKTRWGRGGKAAVAIEFNGTVKARETW